MSSLFFSTPIYLLTLLAIAAPIIIHLLSKNKGKIIKVGTLAFFPEKQSEKLTQISLTEKLLLLLRILILLIAGLLLAGVWWFADDEAKGPVYIVTESWVLNTNEQEKRQLLERVSAQDSALLLLSPEPSVSKGATQLSHISAILPISPEQLLAFEKTKNNQQSQNSLKQNKSMWLSLKRASFKLAQNAQIELYATNHASLFSGQPITITQSINWHIKELTPEKELKPDAFTPINVVMVANNTSSDNNFVVDQFKWASEQLTLLTPANITFKYFDSIAEFLAQSSAKNNEQKIDWLFDVSEQSNHELWLKALANENIAVRNLWQYVAQTSAIKKVNASQVSEGKYLLTPFQLKQLTAYQPIENARIVWQTEQGKPILVKSKLSDITLFNFYSRFSSQWSNLAEQAQFIQVLYRLFYNQELSQVQLTRAYLSLEQIKHVTDSILDENSLSIDRDLATIYLEKSKEPFTILLVILLVAFWTCERLLSEYSLRSKKVIVEQVTNG